jgi:hypothetical protein
MQQLAYLKVIIPSDGYVAKLEMKLLHYPDLI